MRVDQQLEFPAAVERVWDLLIDVGTSAQCIPGAESVQTIDAQHFAVRVNVKVGPVAVAFDCQVEVAELDPVSRSGSFRIVGRDTKVGAGLRALSAFTLVGDAAHTTLNLNTETDISGKIAQYGHGIIRQRADATLQAFGECVRARLLQPV
jgi:carbon monoxide dehydrogenase subunit G